MNNVELRWLECPTGKKLMNEWGYYYPETNKRLQYRCRIEITDYSNDYHDKVMFWSDWKDVPTVKEEK